MLAYLFTFQGRISRLGYLGRMFAFFAIVVVGAILVTVLTGFQAAGAIQQNLANQYEHGHISRQSLMALRSTNYAILIYALAVYAIGLLASLSRQARRLHDINLSGWYVLTPIAICFAVGLMAGFAGGAAAVQNAHAGFHAAPMPAAPGLLAAVAIAGVIVLLYLLVLLFWPGTKGDNNFGESPDPIYRGATTKNVKGVGVVGKRIVAVLDYRLPEDQLTMMAIIRQENPDIQKIFVSPERDRIEFTLSPGSQNNRKTLARVLKDFGLSVRNLEIG